MNLSAAIYAIRWLLRDTFRQAAASGLFGLMLGVSGLCILFCLSVGVAGDTPLRRPGETVEFLPAHDPQATPSRLANQGVTVVRGELTLGFGAVRVPLGRDGTDAVRFVQLLLAGGVADAAGLLLALVWTAGFLPTFLDPSAAAVLLAKPVPRWSLLVGKYLGVLAFVGFQAAVFVGGTWLALGLGTGIWDPLYLWCLPLLLVHFAIFFSFSTLLAVGTRSTVTCVIGSLLFWFLCWGMNYGRHAVVALPDLEGVSAALPALVEAGYWILPKPADMGMILFDALQADNYFSRITAFQLLRSRGAFLPELSLVTSLLFTAAVLAVAAWQFVTTDY
jgi:hypothetical protein